MCFPWDSAVRFSVQRLSGAQSGDGSVDALDVCIDMAGALARNAGPDALVAHTEIASATASVTINPSFLMLPRPVLWREARAALADYFRPNATTGRHGELALRLAGWRSDGAQ